MTEPTSAVEAVEKEFALPLQTLYRTALAAYKEHGQAASAPYATRTELMALTKLIVHGPYNADNDDDSGFFNFLGSDRRAAWQALGALPKTDAMARFVTLLDGVCPPFRDMVNKEVLALQLRQQNEARAVEEKQNSTQATPQPSLQLHKHEIQAALNSQTIHQFRAYVEQQHPGNPQQQELLIAQLQEQHYEQYMAQVYEQQAASMAEDDSEGVSEAGQDVPSNPAMPVASMWTRPEIAEFKSQIAKEGAEGVIKVGHGETVTVRVPTHQDGTCLFWEFATDHYDIGFGVYFEWSIATSNTVTVHVSESSDEEELEEVEGDVESKARASERAQVDDIVPIYRRDSHTEVYAGSHVYPGRGVYLLKFDNSYSLWRSKQLYYRVYYSK